MLFWPRTMCIIIRTLPTSSYEPYLSVKFKKKMNAVTTNQNKKNSEKYVWKNKCELCGGRTASTMCPADIDHTYYCAVCIQDVEEQSGYYDNDDELFQSLLADAEAIEELEKKYDEAIKNIKLPTAEEIKNVKPTLDASQLEKLFGN